MPLVPPNLDNRTFNQLVTEIRRRIPTATPEWTDLNPSDPGITLAELFAFLSEQLLFQVNQVPTKGLITFLQMVGAELHPATPAVADVTFTALGVSGGPDLTFDLRKGTRVETSGPPPDRSRCCRHAVADSGTSHAVRLRAAFDLIRMERGLPMAPASISSRALRTGG